MWKGFSLFSKPLIHSCFFLFVFLFRSENWTAKCHWGIFYLMTITGKPVWLKSETEIKWQNRHTAFSHTCEVSARDTRHTVPASRWSESLNFCPFWALGWPLGGSLPSLGPGTPSSHHTSPVHTDTRCQGQRHRILTLWIHLGATPGPTSESCKEWCPGQSCSALKGQEDEGQQPGLICKQKEAVNHKCIVQVIKQSPFPEDSKLQIFQDVFLNFITPFPLCFSVTQVCFLLNDCLSWRLWTIQLPSQWYLVLGGMDQKWGPAFCGDNRVSPRPPGTEWRIGVKGPLLQLPCGCQPPDLVWVQ